MCQNLDFYFLLFYCLFMLVLFLFIHLFVFQFLLLFSIFLFGFVALLFPPLFYLCFSAWWISSLAGTNLLGLKGLLFVVVVVVKHEFCDRSVENLNLHNILCFP
jgi:hypothetical protein